ncbi:MAG: hypothetical protein IT444_05670 [Phycisphaeraceae bacterium]|nr:hypothetical protein [Phycisphaeraceae bacterium]
MRRGFPAILLVLILTVTGRAADTATPAMLAYFRADPRKFNPSSAWMSGFIRLLDAVGVVPLSEQPVADGVLLATVMGTYPHSLTLLDFRANRVIPGKVDIERVQAVLTLDAPGQFASLRQTLTTILSHYGQPQERLQTALALPGDRHGVTYRLKDWPQWMAIEWFAESDRFYLAVGAGALNRYFKEAQQREDSPQLGSHRRETMTAAATRPADNPIEFYIDLASLRRSVPTLFQTGRLSPLLELFQLDKTDSWMLHGWWSQRFLMLAITTQQEGKTTSRLLTRDTWPADGGVPQPEGSFYLVAPIDWSAAADRAVEFIRRTIEPEKRSAFEEELAAYRRATDIDLASFFKQFRPVLLMSDYPRAWLPVPGTATVYAPLRQGASEKTAREQFAALMRPVIEGLPGPSSQKAESDDLTVEYDAKADVYWVDSPLRQLFKAPAWGWCSTPEDGILVSSFSPTAVLENRKWLGESHHAERQEQPSSSGR